jgi:hypothetical protein
MFVPQSHQIEKNDENKKTFNKYYKNDYRKNFKNMKIGQK